MIDDEDVLLDPLYIASHAYKKAFPEEGGFPAEMAPPMGDEELIEFIWECIRKGKPYKVPISEDILY